MTAGEMRNWTNRLTSILEGAKDMREERLALLAQDIERLYGNLGKNCPYAERLLKTVNEWRGVL